jgi:hypothetical protein
MEAIVNGKADAWRRRIDDQRASGQSVRAWCKANGSQECSFYWWRSRLGLSPKKRRPSKPAKAKPKPLAFAQVVVHPSTAEAKPIAAEPLRLRFAGGHELILPASMPLEQVAKLVRAIESGGEAYRGTT